MAGNDSSVIGVARCWALARSVQVGRVALWLADGPELLPVNHAVDHGTIVFRTGEGSKLAASAGSTVVFEVDGYDESAGEAWSVVVKGRAGQITNLHELVDSMHLDVHPWHARPKNVMVRIVPDEVSGRSFPTADPAIWRNVLTQAPIARPE